VAASDEFLTISSGAVRGRIHRPSGVIELSGPNRAGAADGLVVKFSPAVGVVRGSARTIGLVRSFTESDEGLELVQEFGSGQIRARLSFALPLVLRYEVLDWQGQAPESTTISAAADAAEHFYGFGEKFNALDHTGKVVDVLTFDQPGNKGDRSYKVAPWFISTRGYGLHLDSTARSRFDMRTGAVGRYSITNQFGTLKFNVVYGPTLTDVLARYTAYAGRPSLPPPFAFGTWISSDVWRSGGEVRYVVTKFRERGIPGSVFVFDSPWEVAYNDFKFNIGASNATQFGRGGTFEEEDFAGFSSLSELMTFFREHGLKVVCWMTPFVNVSSQNEGIPGQNLGKAVLAGEQDQFFVQDGNTGRPLVVPWWKGRGRPIDFTNPAARAWLIERLSELLVACEVNVKAGTETAIGGFKTDDGEVGNDQNTYIPERAKYHSGATGRSFVNGYCVEYHRTVNGVLGDRGVLFARSGFTGTQAFSGCWAGDNEPNFGEENGLPSVIIAGLSAAMSGYSIWGHDVGGYLNGNFSPVSPADLLIRWSQFGCFSPIFQMHRQVHASNFRQYPWGYPTPGETLQRNRALENFKFYARLHTRLFPYLYTYAKQSRETGIPIMRPLVLMHPDDPNTFAIRHTYYFGADLVVAPIIRPLANRRNVYLPEGTWFDFWSNERHQGEQVITWTNPNQPSQPQSKIPVFVRRGGIIPLILGDDVATLCDADYVNNLEVVTWNGGLELRIYPDDDARLTLYDGTEIRCTKAATTRKVTVKSPLVRLMLVRVLATKPTAVHREGIALPQFAALAAFEAASTGWRFDMATGFVLVKYSHPGGDSELVLDA